MKLVEDFHVTQLRFACLKSIMETPEQCVKSIQSSEAFLDLAETFSFCSLIIFAKEAPLYIGITNQKYCFMKKLDNMSYIVCEMRVRSQCHHKCLWFYDLKKSKV